MPLDRLAAGPRTPTDWEELVTRISRLADALESSDRDAAAGWAELAQLNAEYAIQAGATSVTTTPNTSNPFLVESVLVSVPTGATGIITLGGLVMPAAAGTSVWAPVKVLLLTSQVRSLVVTNAGTVALALMGRQLSDRALVR